jgi:hypothetical protein
VYTSTGLENKKKATKGGSEKDIFVGQSYCSQVTPQQSL